MESSNYIQIVSLWKCTLDSLYLDHSNCILRVPRGPPWRSDCPIWREKLKEREGRNTQELSGSMCGCKIRFMRTGTCSVLYLYLIYPIPRIMATTVSSAGSLMLNTDCLTKEMEGWMDGWMICSCVVKLTTWGGLSVWPPGYSFNPIFQIMGLLEGSGCRRS